MKSINYLFIVVVVIYNVLQSESNISNTKDFEFENPDITFDLNKAGSYKTIWYEGFRSTKNDDIIKNEKKSKYGQLIWISLGYPQLVHFNKRNTTSFINLNSAGFSIHIKALTDEDKVNFVQRVKDVYNIDISTKQIVNLIPSSLTCSIELHINNLKSKILHGRVKNLNELPFRVDFDARKGSEERLVIENLSADIDNDMSFDCTFEFYGKASKMNTLTISAENWNNLDLIKKIFGPSKENYVTRDQINELASELYTSLNVYEEYEIPEIQFTENFVQDLIIYFSDKVTSHVRFNEAVKYLSSYGYNNEDLKPDIIKKELSNIFKVELISSSSEKNIISNRDHFENLRLNSEIHGSLYGAISGSTEAAVNYFDRNTNNLVVYEKNLKDQLNKLNKFTQENIIWEIEDEKIIPKSLNVTKLIKTKFLKKHVFSKIKKQKYETLYRKNFTLYNQDTHREIIDQLEFSKIIENKVYAKVDDKMKAYEKHFNSTIQDVKDKKDGVNLSAFSNITSKIDTYEIRFNSTIHKIKSFMEQYFALKKTLTGHRGLSGWHTNWELLVLPNEELASCSDDKTIKIFNTRNGFVKARLTGHNNICDSLVILPNGDLASGSFDNTIKIWNITERSLKATLIGHNDTVFALAVLSNGYLVSGSRYQIKIWDVSTGSVTKTLTGHSSEVNSLVVLPNGDLASSSFDTTIKIWNTKDGSVKKTLLGHNSWVWPLVVLPNGSLASGSGDTTIKIWDYNEGLLKKTLKGHDRVCALAVLPNGDLASGYYDGTIKIWNVNDAVVKRTLVGHISYTCSLVVLPNGYLASSSDDDKTIKIWEINKDIQFI